MLSAFTSRASLTFSTSGALYWMKHLFIIKRKFRRNECSFPHEHFPIIPANKNVIWTQQCSKTHFLCACFCWDFRLSLSDLVQKFPFGGIIGYRISNFDSIICNYMQLYMMLLELFEHIVVEVQATVKSLTRNKFMFAQSRDWTTPLPLRKSLSALHFQFCWLLKQSVFDCTRYRANWEKHN